MSERQVMQKHFKPILVQVVKAWKIFSKFSISYKSLRAKRKMARKKLLTHQLAKARQAAEQNTAMHFIK